MKKFILLLGISLCFFGCTSHQEFEAFGNRLAIIMVGFLALTCLLALGGFIWQEYFAATYSQCFKLSHHMLSGSDTFYNLIVTMSEEDDLEEIRLQMQLQGSSSRYPADKEPLSLLTEMFTQPGGTSCLKVEQKDGNQWDFRFEGMTKTLEAFRHVFKELKNLQQPNIEIRCLVKGTRIHVKELKKLFPKELVPGLNESELIIHSWD